MTNADENIKRLQDATDGLTEAIANSVQYCFKSCLNCEHFYEQQERCNLYNGQRPPARVIAFGCPAFSLIIVPF